MGRRVVNNFVAKHARKYNKAVVMRDKSKYYKKVKHKGRESGPYSFV